MHAITDRATRVRALAAFLVTLAGLALGGSTATAGPPGSQGGAPSDVGDVEAARRYLLQTLPLYVGELPAEGVVGAFEYGTVPFEQVLRFQADLGIVDTAWSSAKRNPCLVAVWSSAAVSFHAPRPRFGMPAELPGDTFVIIIEPSQDLELRAVVAAERLTDLRTGALDWRRESLLVRPSS
jgi:hypothetical protein